MNRIKTFSFNSRRLCAGIAALASAAVLLTACGNDRAASVTPVTTTTSSTVATTTVTTTATTVTTTTTTTTTTLPTTTTAAPTAPPTTTPTAPPATTPTTAPTQAPVPSYWSDGITPSVWKANCNDYISLRPAPYSGDLITTIPAGATMTLLEWSGIYAKVSYGGTVGYVLANWIAPADGINVGLSVVTVTNVYSYQQMCADIDTLCAKYPSVCRRGSIGNSELGRDIPVLKLGAESASHHVLIQGAIHAREHLTAWLMMAMADSAVSRGAVPQDVCYHLIPMSNPDGVILAQTGVLTDAQRAVYAADRAAGYTSADEASYAATWKANGLGVDLNRNFDAGWSVIDGHAAPSAERYKGEAPFTAAEARALRDYTLSRSFDVTVSYHSMGSIIYYEYGSSQPVNNLSLDLGYAVGDVSGYPLIGSGSVEGGGYKDWAMEALGIPSLTIEVGCTDSPLAFREVYNVLYRNLPVIDAIARWVKQ